MLTPTSDQSGEVSHRMSSSSPIYYIYNAAIQRQLFGYASAIGMLLFGVILIVTVAQRFAIRERA